MEPIIVILTALAPVIILLSYIYCKDKSSPEPVKSLLKAFGFGVVSVFVSLAISTPLGALGFYPDNPTTIFGCICTSFFGAAIPEEIAKLLMLWLLLRKNRYFDEEMDGIVYAVCVSLGFAALENIMYLFTNAEAYLSVGIARAIFAVPGHFCFGITMGYYYSLVKFYPKYPDNKKILVLLAPILVHGLYDSILFIIDVLPWVSGALTILFIIFCFKMWKYASHRIKEHLDRDSK